MGVQFYTLKGAEHALPWGKTRISKEISEVLNNALHGRQVPDIDRACKPAEYIYIYIYEKPFVSLFAVRAA